METENNDRTDCVFLILVVNFENEQWPCGSIEYIDI